MKLSAWTGLLERERLRPSLLAKYQFNCVQHQLFTSINSVHFELIFLELANSDGRLIIKCQQRQLFGKLQFVKLFSADKATTGHCEMLLELAGWLAGWIDVTNAGWCFDFCSQKKSRLTRKKIISTLGLACHASPMELATTRGRTDGST